MANRYDNGSVAKFNPFSYQELAVTPMMQRQKHDQLIAEQELLRQGLAKTNPHEKYYNEAVRLKNDLNNQINSQADLLSKEGVNPNSQANFIKLNRDYQETMSPTGKLGMINAHNVNLQSTYKNYIDEAIKAGQSPAIAKLHADQAIQKHMQQPLYDERGRVVDFSAGNAAPKYIDNVKWINDLATKVGFTQSNWAQASSGMSKNADGRFVVNESAKGMTKDNIENLNRLAQAANREVSDPASEIRQNIDYNFKNPQTELDGMLNQLYARRERESGVTDRNKSYGSVDWNENGVNGYGNMDIIDTQHALKIDKFTNRSHGTNVLELNKLESKIKNKTATQQEQVEYNSLKKFVDQTKTKVGSNPQYKEEKSLEDKYNYDLISKSSPKMRATYSAIKNGTLDGVYKVSGNTATVDPVKLAKKGYTVAEIREIKEVANKFLNNPHTKNITKIFSETNKLNNNYANYYNLFPNNSKGTKAYEDFNKNMESIFSGGTANTLQNLGLISAIQIDGVNDYDINDDDRNGIQHLLSNDIKPGSFNISGFSENNVTGLPSIRMSFNTKDSSKGYTKGNYSWKDNKTLGQEGSKVSFDLDFKKLSNIPDNANKLQTMNALGKLAEFIYNNGGENGQNISKKILQTISENK